MQIRFFHHASTLLAGLLISSLTLAGDNGAQVGEVTHSPTLESIAVPALGGVGLLALTVLLGLFGYRVLKGEHGAGTKWLLAACVTTALASGGSGLKLINDAYAIVMVSFVDAQGDTIEFFESDVNISFNGGCSVNAGDKGFVTVANSTGETQFLTDVSIARPGPCERIDYEEEQGGGNGGNGGAFLGECLDSPPLEMAPDDSCEIALCCWLSPG